MTAVRVCEPMRAEIWYKLWLSLTDDQIAIFKALEKRARVMPKERRASVLGPKGFSTYCVYCGLYEATVIDHIKPIALLGDSRLENLAPACADCNSRKSVRLNWPRMSWDVLNPQATGLVIDEGAYDSGYDSGWDNMAYIEHSSRTSHHYDLDFVIPENWERKSPWVIEGPIKTMGGTYYVHGYDPQAWKLKGVLSTEAART